MFLNLILYVVVHKHNELQLSNKIKMGQSLASRLADEISRTRLEESPIAPPIRKIFRSWNSTDLWTALRRYWNEFPKKEEWLEYGDVTHILCLHDAEAMLLWDAFANSGMVR